MHKNEEADTQRPPPIDFSKLSDSEKLNHLCDIVVDIADGLIVMNKNMTVLNSRLEVAEEDNRNFKESLDRYEAALVEHGRTLQNLLDHLLGAGTTFFDSHQENGNGRPGLRRV